MNGLFKGNGAVAAMLSIGLGHAAPPQLHVDGARIVDADGNRVVLRGVDCAGLEWTSDGEGHILRTVNVAIRDWHANNLRIPVSQDRWFGTGPEQRDHGTAYRALVRRVIDEITSQGSYAIFDLHWNDGGVWGQNIGQHVMPDMNSVTFWRDAARTFRNEPGVIFDLYNEPHDVTWQVWRNGGKVTEAVRPDRRLNPTAKTTRVSYVTPGMQRLLETVRNEGANNVVLAGGLDWSYDMSGFLKGYALSDPGGNGVVYANHDYPFKGDSVAKWLTKMEAATAKIPVIVSEFGDNPPARRPNAPMTDPGTPSRQNHDWLLETLQIMRDHRWNWTA